MAKSAKSAKSRGTAAAAAAAGAAAATTTGKSGGPAKRRKARRSTFSSYIYRTLRIVAPDAKISKAGMAVMNAFVEDMLSRTVVDADRLLHKSGRSTLLMADMQAAAKFLLTGDLGESALEEAAHHTRMYEANRA